MRLAALYWVLLDLPCTGATCDELLVGGVTPILRDIPFLLRLRRLATVAAILGGLFIVFMFIAANPDWPWFSGRGYDLVRELFGCGRRMGAGALGSVLAALTGIAVMVLGSSERLRRKYLRKTILAYIFAIIVIALALGNGQDCNFNEITERHSRTGPPR